MKCDWQGLLRLLPPWMRPEVDHLGREALQEIRLRTGQPLELVLTDRSVYLDDAVKTTDLDFCINAASQYSPWAASSISSGYITAQGGHRIGICGQLVMIEGKIQSLSCITSLCIRVARDYPGIAQDTVGLVGSILIIGSPGRGKTTLLRDMIRQKSNIACATVAVVDERRELFPVSSGNFVFSPGMHTDVLSGCGKSTGLEILIRTMNPRYVAVDEITAPEDCEAIIQSRGCGASILATAHASDLNDLMSRPVYKPILNAEIFSCIIVMQQNKSWKLERVNR